MQPDSMDVPPVSTEPVVSPREPFWGYVDLALMIGILAAGMVVLVGIAAGIVALDPRLQSNPAPVLLPIQFALYGVVYFAFVYIFNVRYNRPVMESLGWRRTNFRPGIAALIGGALAFVISGIATLLGTPKVESPIEQFTNSPLSLAVIAIMAVTVAPLFEELLFRGFLQPLFSRTFGITIGIVLTAVLFGALHLPEYSSVWQYGLAVSIVGVVLGYIRERTQSVIPGTIMHACYNSIFVIALVASKFAKTK